MLATHWAEQQRCRSTTSAESAVVWEISTLMRYRSGLPPQASLASDVAGSRFEVLDDDHAAAAMGARVRELPRIGAARLLGRRWGQVQEFTHGFHRFGAIGAGEQAVVADAVETLGEDVAEEAADELADVERHGRVAAGSLDPIVLDLEGDALLVERDQAAVRDGDTVGVARQIGEHGLGTGERALGIDEPAGLSERGEERGECFGSGEMRAGAEELQLARRVCRCKLGEH